MRKKIIIIISVILLVILGFGFWLYLSFNGSILKRLVMTKNAEQYVQMFYPDEDLEVDFAVYDFKMCAYYSKVHAPSGGDLYFHVYRNSDGELTDDFGIRVLQKENTILRLGTELDEYTKKFLAESFPHRISLAMCSVTEELTESVRNGLTVNMPFDSSDYPLPTEMTVWVETAGEKPSWEEMAERLRELRAVTKEAFPFVTRYSVSIQDRYVEKDGAYGPADHSGDISVFGVPAEIIETDRLENWLENEKQKQKAE